MTNNKQAIDKIDGLYRLYELGSVNEYGHVVVGLTDKDRKDLLACLAAVKEMVETDGELKPCPFCGGIMSIKSRRTWPMDVDDEGVFLRRVSCLNDDCISFPETEETTEQLVRKWNTRPTDALIEKLTEGE